MKKITTTVLALCALALQFSHAAKPLKNESIRPNVLFVISDDLGARLGCYGDPLARTPQLDALAARGVLFSNCFTQYPTCGPSRASMLSGLYPFQIDARGNGANWSNAHRFFTTFPALFRNQGYKTARVGKIFHMGIPDGIGSAGPDDPDAWEIAINNSGWDGQEKNIKQAVKHGTVRNPGVAISHLAPDIQNETMADGVGTREALRLMSELHPDKTGKPFMLCVGYYRPHPPMIAPRAHWNAISTNGLRLPRVPENDRADVPPINTHLHGVGFNFIPETVGRSYTHAYHAAVNFIDTEVGKLLAGLKEKGLDRNTIVIFTGDQGFHLGEHGHWHKSTFFEEACRVPLIVADPRTKVRGGQHTGLCGLIDLYPTLCELAGVSADHKLSGRSLASILQEPSLPGKEWELTEGSPGGASIRTEHHRYTEWSGGKKGSMLYDLKTDPGEFTNLIGDKDHAPVAQRLKKLLHQNGPSKPFRTVRVVYLVSADRQERPEYTAAIRHAITDIQRWYAKQLGGPTFRLHEPIVEVVKSREKADWFYGNPNGRKKDDWGFNNAFQEVRRLLGAKYNDPKHIWLIYSDGPGNKGRGGNGVACLPEDDLLGLVGKHPKQKSKLRWIAGLGHEAGHAFGLPHPKDTRKHADALMWTGIYRKYPDGTYLTDEDKTILSRSPFFYREDGRPIFRKGKVVSRAKYSGGAFEKLSGEGKTLWVETKTDSALEYVFEENARDEKFIEIRDISRRMTIRLPKAGGRALFSRDGRIWAPLYEIEWDQ